MVLNRAKHHVNTFIGEYLTVIQIFTMKLKKQYLTLFTITLKLLTSQQTTSSPTGAAYKYWQKWHILFEEYLHN